LLASVSTHLRLRRKLTGPASGKKNDRRKNKN
jgi:hypothetical protein